MSYVLISVHDKTGLEPLARAITQTGYKILSTGGTADHLRKLGFQITEVASYTGSPEVLGGRVKTLHPKIHAGILCRRDNPKDMEELGKMTAESIDIVICNLYPFEKTIASQDCTLEKAIEEIDIGGVTLLRASAKNFQHVTILSDPSQYNEFIERLSLGKFDIEYKKSLAIKAFRTTNAYDGTISAYLEGSTKDQLGVPETIHTMQVMPLRYGENPHQQAGLYSVGNNEWPITSLQGKELSYNNILDIDAALSTLLEFDPTCAVIVKHLTPCGVAIGTSMKEAYLRALECDPVSAYGGIVAINDTIDEEAAIEVGKLFVEVIIAKDFSKEALSIFAKKKNTRLVTYNKDLPRAKFAIRSTMFGTLFQQPDLSLADSFKIAGETPVSEHDLEQLTFAMAVAKHVKSNAIVLAKDFATVGVGAGQPNRVGSVKIASSQAGEKAKGSYLASDAYFPFADSIEHAASFGVKAIIEPGGSIRDDEVIAAANKLGIGLVFSGQRHFNH
ncbi:MAG: bifunctional phosphoribosylaminoimidazolecarboxamide formyltransferase/IMP cyclohydrolase [Caldisericales bacterium]|nr:bifunctional phosphoribosylaminoimidazolecarboxamide formyltransferase/IMP cyclohydrolase [Caldisericales bacterium]